MKVYKAVIHLHSRHSFDSFTPPSRIVDKAVSKGIDILCICDHDTVAGAKEAYRYAGKKYKNKIRIIIGAEFNSESGDIIGFDIKEDIADKNSFEIIRKIKEQNGLVLLPHPYYHHKNIEQLAEASDLIEIFNARIDKALNEKALELANKLRKPFYVASDAHFLRDSFLCINELRSSDALQESDIKKILLVSERGFTTAYSPNKNIYKSQAIKGIKHRKIGLVIISFKKYFFSMFKR